MNDNEKFVIGSGNLYVMEFTGTIPANNVIETEANRLGYISGGATLEYKPKFYEVRDDLGVIIKSVITEEEVILKSGVLTWNGVTLGKLSATATVSEVGNTRTVKIGGIANNDDKQYLIHFVNVDEITRVTIVGNNQSGFNLAFAKDKETVINAEFKAAPQDSDGTLIKYSETIILITFPVVSVAGATTGKTAITVTNTLGSGNSYKLKTAASVDMPLYGDATTGYTAWNGTDDITAVTGNEIVIAECNDDGKIVKAGKTTVVSKA